MKGKEYKFVNLGELRFAEIKDGENIIKSFWIDSKASYASYLGKGDKNNCGKKLGDGF